MVILFANWFYYPHLVAMGLTSREICVDEYFIFTLFWRQNNVNPKILPVPNLSKIEPISCQICKLLHFPFHNTFIIIGCQGNIWGQWENDPQRCEIMLENSFQYLWILVSYLKSFQGTESAPPPPPPSQAIWRWEKLQILCESHKKHVFLVGGNSK